MQLNKELLKTLLLFIGVVGITLSGLNWNIGITAWIAPVFLLIYTRKAKWYHLLIFFLFISVSGAISQTNNNLFGLASVNIFNGLSFGIVYSIPYLLDKVLYKKGVKFYYSLLFPSAFVLIEYAMSPVIGVWGSIAHTQYELKPLIQLSSIFGIYGITFMVYWFSSVVNWIIENKSEYRSVYKGMLIFGGVLFIVLLYGELRMNFHNTDVKSIKVAAIVSETDIHKIAEKEKSAFEALATNNNIEIPSQLFSDSLSIQTLVNRTNKASKQGAKIIVWNEIALILNQNQKKSLLAEIQSICKQARVYVLMSFLEECADKNRKPFNNISILVSSKGEIVWEYLKSFLHPVGEIPIINGGNFNMPFVQTEYGKIGNAICADMDMINYIQQAGKQSADILLVPAFDWEGITPLHSQMASLQGIQYGFSIIRSNGKGLTAVYDYMGNIIASINTLTSDTKILYADIPVKSVQTFYSNFGNIIVYGAIIFLLFLIITKFLKRRA